MKLPWEFVLRMKALLGNEFENFIETYSHSRAYGLRANTLKLSVDEFVKIVGKPLERVPWTEDGFYYDEGENPGKHPYYHAGLYYIQEPSAMAPAGILAARPGERVLDLCAAPGGKTVQIAASMKGQGVLVANEINPSRVKALIKNIELCGVKNAIITNETPHKLSARFSGYFDKILVDAPCSGEGMMRKDENAARGWKLYNSRKCSLIQRDILEEADKMLKCGGTIVYSTCTFSTEENEETIENFLDLHPNYELVEIKKSNGVGAGINNSGYLHDFSRCARFWPHKIKGEGHFVAALLKNDESETGGRFSCLTFETREPSPCLAEFFRNSLNIDVPETVRIYGNYVYALGSGFPEISGLNVVRTGWRLGCIEKGIFEPGQSLIMGLLAEDIINTIEYDLEAVEVNKYLKGETLFSDCKNGWAAICIGSFPLGWVKVQDGMLKNYYPKGWRKMA